MRTLAAHHIQANIAGDQRAMYGLLVARHGGKDALGRCGERTVVNVFRHRACPGSRQPFDDLIIRPVGKLLWLNEKQSLEFVDHDVWDEIGVSNVPSHTPLYEQRFLMAASLSRPLGVMLARKVAWQSVQVEQRGDVGSRILLAKSFDLRPHLSIF